MNKDLFGNEIITNPLLRDKFIEPPFSVLDTKSANWQNRKRNWMKLAMKSEIGRDSRLAYNTQQWVQDKGMKGWSSKNAGTSIFDPALCELIYHWFCKEKGEILDPFAGGSVRGIVANYLSYNYTGIELRQEQVESNYEQGREILPDNCPHWICGDSNKELNDFDKSFDFVFSCPPYGDLEKYSDLKDDISNMTYNEFLKVYESIIFKSCKLLKRDCYACFVIGEFRDKKGNYRGFVADTINAFKKAGMQYYNEAVLLTSLGNASMRAKGNMVSEKLVKVHQTILIFKKQTQ